MKDIRNRLKEMYWLEYNAMRFAISPGITYGKTADARARAAEAHKPLKKYFTSTHVLIADLNILLDVMETITCQGGEVKILRDLVLDAFRALKEEQ